MPDERGSPHEDVVLCQCSDERALKPVETHSIGFPVPTPVPRLPGARSGRRSNNRAQLGAVTSPTPHVGWDIRHQTYAQNRWTVSVGFFVPALG